MSFNRIAAAGLGALLVWMGILSAQTANSARLEEEWDQQVNTLLKRFETEPLGKKLSPENVAAYKADVQNIKRRQAELRKIFENPNARFPGAPPEKLQQTAEYMISRCSHYQYIGGIEYSWEQGDFLADRKHVLNRVNDARGRRINTVTIDDKMLIEAFRKRYGYSVPEVKKPADPAASWIAEVDELLKQYEKARDEGRIPEKYRANFERSSHQFRELVNTVKEMIADPQNFFLRTGSTDEKQPSGNLSTSGSFTLYGLFTATKNFQSDLLEVNAINAIVITADSRDVGAQIEAKYEAKYGNENRRIARRDRIVSLALRGRESSVQDPSANWSVYKTPSVTSNKLGMQFVTISKTGAMVGNPCCKQPRTDSKYQTERPYECIYIYNDYQLGMHEVTIGQFRKFVNETHYKTTAEQNARGGYGYDPATKQIVQSKEFHWEKVGFDVTDNHPVTNVSYHDAVAFCRWLSKVEGVQYRLPTENEWEWAAQPGWKYRNGQDALPDNHHPRQSNCPDTTLVGKMPGVKLTGVERYNDGHAFTSPVASYKPNARGVYDMIGNVEEWCFSRYYIQEGLISQLPPDKLDHTTANQRVVRGGSWLGAGIGAGIDGPLHVGVTGRCGMDPDSYQVTVGFRVLRDLDGTNPRPEELTYAEIDQLIAKLVAASLANIDCRNLPEFKSLTGQGERAVNRLWATPMVGTESQFRTLVNCIEGCGAGALPLLISARAEVESDKQRAVTMIGNLATSLSQEWTETHWGITRRYYRSGVGPAFDRGRPLLDLLDIRLAAINRMINNAATVTAK